jgi:4-HFC-P synthase
VTRMLASVANAAEAGVVVQLGADVVDLKDARQGALGAVSLEIARAAIAEVAGRSETSAALGDPPYAEEALPEAARALWAIGVDYVKLAVDAPTLDRLGESLSKLARDVALVGMMFADEKPDFSLSSLNSGSWVSKAQCWTPGRRCRVAARARAQHPRHYPQARCDRGRGRHGNPAGSRLGLGGGATGQRPRSRRVSAPVPPKSRTNRPHASVRRRVLLRAFGVDRG